MILPEVSTLEIELDACQPPERITVSQWADRNRVLTPRLAAKPGPWRTSFMPFLEKIMDSWADPEVEEIVCCKGSQAGMSEAAFNCLGYTICQDPGPALVIYPTESIAEWASENRFMDMIKSSAELGKRYNERESEKLELQFRGMYASLTGSNSPASLSAKPMRYIIFDEVDKYPPFSGKEANPLKLGKERTKTFQNRKILYISTPTLEQGNIWKLKRTSDVCYRYYLKCPHCKKDLLFLFPNVKWPKELTVAMEEEKTLEGRAKILRAIEESTWYECPNCGARIEDRDKPAMLRGGEWKPEGEVPENKKRVCFWWNSIYSPQISFGQVAVEFLGAKSCPEDLMNFVNSWLAEPFKAAAVKSRPEKIKKAIGVHKRGVIPDQAVAITAGVDVQKMEAYYSIRAWGPGLTSWLIDYGRFDTWNGSDLQAGLQAHIVDPVFRFEDGRVAQVNYCLVDSGYRTDEVYDACLVYMEVLTAVKGSSSRTMDSFYRKRVIDRKDRKMDGQTLVEANTGLLKDFIHGRMNKEPGSLGSWSLFQDCSMDYIKQIAAEEKVPFTDKRTKELRYEWRKTTEHADNHWLDCEVYNALAARMLNLQYMPTREEEEQLNRPEKEEKSDWLNGGSGWLSSR